MKYVATLFMLLGGMICLFVSVSHAEKWLKGSVEFEQDGYRLELFAQKKIATKAFLQGQGFSSDHSRFYSEKHCVFGSAQGNILTGKSAPPLEIDLTKWRLLYKGKSLPILTRQSWKKIWQKRGVSEDLQNAFYWTLFPTHPSYGPTDYNWGGVTMVMPAGESFDLKIWWKRGSKEHTAIIKGLKCRD